MKTDLAKSYELCRSLNAKHGKTYYLATLLLPPKKRPYVHALYGFARYADEIVDDLESTLSLQAKKQHLQEFGDRIISDIKMGHSSDPVGAAFVDTITTWKIPLEHVEAFLNSMAMDLEISSYETFSDLERYVYGSAAVIGLQMVPILEPIDESAYEFAKDLGVAFQLANFIRDVNEDLDRGRIYLPLAELRSHGVTPEVLGQRKATPEIKKALAEQIARVRTLQKNADSGIKLLHPSSRPCIQAASTLYCGIVDEVEKIDFEIFDQRARTSMARRLSIFIPSLMKSYLSR